MGHDKLGRHVWLCTPAHIVGFIQLRLKKRLFLLKVIHSNVFEHAFSDVLNSFKKQCYLIILNDSTMLTTM